MLFNFYNPLAALSPQTDALAQQASQVVDGLASTFHAGVADAFSAINNKAGSPSEKTLVCSRTWICSSYTDVHPDARGYRALAAALQEAVAHG